MEELIRLKQAIPPLGEVEIELFEPAASIYRLFQKKEIPRLMNLRQLGQLSRIHTGAHHTRWDYILLKLYLLKVFKTNCPGAGLSNDVPSLGSVSGLQALQAYSLLRNYGHLDGCFETERVVLEACLANRQARDMLVSLIPEDFREWANSLLNDETMFKFYQVLSVVFVKHSCEFQADEELRNRCLDFLHKFYVKGDNRIQILKDRHREIRTLAYLSLDTHYSPVGVEFNLPAILLSARGFGQRLFGSSTSGFQRLNSYIMDYVTNTVYMSPSACWVFAEFRKKAYRKILERLGNCGNTDEYYEHLENLKRNTPNFSPTKRPVFIRFSLHERRFQRPKTERGISAIKELGTKFMMRNSENIGIACIPSGSIPHGYLYFPSGLAKKKGKIATRFRILCEHLASIQSRENRTFIKLGQHSFMLSREMCANIDSLFRGLLYLLTGDQYEVILERGGVPEMVSGVCAGTRARAQKDIAAILKVDYLKRLAVDRLSELECVRTAIAKTSGGVTAVCLSHLKLVHKAEYRKQDEEYEIGEIDGAILVTNRKHSKLFLVESKKQRSGGVADARRKLISLVKDRLKIQDTFEKGIEIDSIIELPRKGACLPIRLP